jgi:hypothetical protein
MDKAGALAMQTLYREETLKGSFEPSRVSGGRYQVAARGRCRRRLTGTAGNPS